jgi:Uma2 family endonuclease
MNAPLHPTKAPRHAFTLEDVLRMQDQGFFADPKRIALHEGDIVEMPADGYRHAKLTMALVRTIVRGTDHFVGAQTTLRLSQTNAPSPDIYILADDLPDGDVPPEQILLVIEIADTSLAADLTETADRYARARVGEFWVVDVKARRVHVHRDPVGGSYPAPEVFEAGDTVAPRRIPDLSLTLDQVLPA